MRREREAATRLTEDGYNKFLSTDQGLREDLDDAIAGLTGGARSSDNSRQEAAKGGIRRKRCPRIRGNYFGILKERMPWT